MTTSTTRNPEVAWWRKPLSRALATTVLIAGAALLLARRMSHRARG
jgi:hypothetical protein